MHKVSPQSNESSHFGLSAREVRAGPRPRCKLLLLLSIVDAFTMMEGSDTDGMGNSPSAMQQNSAQCT